MNKKNIQALPIEKQKHLEEIECIMSVLLSKMKIKSNKKPFCLFFKLIGAKHPSLKTWQYKHTKIVNKKIARKLELLKEFLDIN